MVGSGAWDGVQRVAEESRGAVGDGVRADRAGEGRERGAGGAEKTAREVTTAVDRTDLMEIYGLRVPRAMPRIAVELLCYRTGRGEAQGGLGAHAHFVNAFRLMWPKYQWSEWVEKIVWAFVTCKWVIVIGHQRASKTYTYAHCVFLDYCADPENTLTSLATVTFEGLKLRMWSDLQRSIETAAGMPVGEIFEIRSTTNELRVFPREARQEAAEKFQIHGIAVTQSKDAEGRIRGGHAPRRRIVLDEAQNIAKPIFNAVVNPMSAPDAKCGMLTNPVEKVSEFGELCEPLHGWASVHDTDLSWPLKKFENGICLHLDGLQSPNVRARKSIFTGLLTVENVEEVRKIHGEDSVQWWSLIRGWWPPDGMVSRVFPSSIIEKGKPNLAFDWRPQGCASLDPAFEFDNCVMHFGQLGMPIFGSPGYAVNCTETMTLKLAVSPGSEPKDYQIAHTVMRECKLRAIQPRHFIIDGTGGGRGVVAILQKEWSDEIQVVNYGGAASDRPIRWDSPQKAEDYYIYFITELYFRAAEYVRDGLIGGIGNLDPRTEQDLYARRYELKARSMVQVETKPELKKRLGRSPDFGDALVQFGELLARLGTFVGKPRPGSPHTPSGKWDQARKKAQGRAPREEKEFSYG